MAIIRKHQPATGGRILQGVQDALSIIGERILYLKMFNTEWNVGVRCSKCYNDIYRNSATSSLEGNVCTECFGTTYEGGIGEFYFTEAAIGKLRSSDSFNNAKGQFTKSSRSCRMIWPGQPYRGDYIVRIFDWLNAEDNSVRPGNAGVYKITSSVSVASVKDGFGNSDAPGTIYGTSFNITEQHEDHPLQKLIMPAVSRELISSKQLFVYVPDYTYEGSKQSSSAISSADLTN